MGFYGNITNTSNTTFSFDRIYPNKLSMDANVNNDGIFIGRYVLVEYDQDAAYPVVYKKPNENRFYSSKNFEQATEIKLLTGEQADEYKLTEDDSVISGKQYYKKENNKYIAVSLNNNDIPSDLGLYEYVSTADGVYKGEIVLVQTIQTDNNGNLITILIDFYECVGGSDGIALFDLISEEPNAGKSNYIKNFAIDEKHLNGEQQKSFKGYDSTVWMKSSVTASDGKLISKYVNIADLNSVVPTFDIAADAPTMIPITPHFDADSTNVYYKLHVQPQWGMRVAAANGSDSDVETYWTRENYNPSTGLSTKQYWNKNSGNWVNYTNEEEIQTFDAAIYYNRAGFEEYTRKYVDASLEDNIINIEPTGESGNLYSNHNKDNNKSTAKDIQEIRINLPAIGNMMSDAWDIIHGPNRDDYRGDGENSSLKGRLDSFKDICFNLIAVKSDEDGTFVGSKINNGENYEHGSNEILDQKFSKKDVLEKDDPWIRTYIDTTNLVHSTYKDNSGISQEGNNGIVIQHTFHATKDSETSLNKNNNTISKSEWYKLNYIPKIEVNSENIIHAINGGAEDNIPKQDEIKLYTPYVDATGHVVGKNIETIILPYGYKTISTNGRYNNETINTEEFDGDGKATTKRNNIVADSTLDTLALNSGNKWIRIDTDAANDIVTFSHDVHEISETDNDDTDLNDSTKYNDMTNGNTIIIPDWDFDNAGHITDKHNRTYTLPFGYKYIAVANNGSTETAKPASTVGTQTADSTQGTLTLDSSNKWIVLDKTNNNDVIKFGHLHSELSSGLHALEAQEPKFGKTFKIQTFTTDNAGHLVDKGVETVKIPLPSIVDDDTKNIMTDLTLDEIEGKFTIHRENLGKLKLKDYTTISGNRPNQISAEDTLLSALGKLETTIENLEYSDINNTTQFVSKIVLTDGKIEVKRANAGTLTLTDYTTQGFEGDINSGDTINSAFAKLLNLISHEGKRIDTILDGTGDTTAEVLDTFIELQEYIDTHGTQAKEMVEAINTIYKVENGVESGKLIEKTDALSARINKLNSTKSATKGNYISSIKIEEDTLSIGEESLPTYILTTGDNDGTIKFNEKEVKVAGLGSAAFTESNAYASSNILDTLTLTYVEGEEQKTIQGLINIINDLHSRITTLENIINNSAPEEE